MGLKVALGGKGGVGKTTITALLARCIAAGTEKSVIAIDADPVANLAAGLGISEDKPITPISGLSELIAERTGAQPGTMGGFFTLNPKVDDIPERFSLQRDGVKLLVMGTVKSGGSGCICPESTILKALMTHLVLYRDDIVLMDMEAGVEHLGRATSGSVDALVIIVNPGSRSRVAASQIKKLATDIGIKNIVILGNRVKNEEDKTLIDTTLPGHQVLGYIPEMEEIVKADRDGVRPFENINDAPQAIFDVAKKLASLNER